MMLARPSVLEVDVACEFLENDKYTSLHVVDRCFRHSFFDCYAHFSAVVGPTLEYLDLLRGTQFRVVSDFLGTLEDSTRIQSRNAWKPGSAAARARACITRTPGDEKVEIHCGGRATCGAMRSMRMDPSPRARRVPMLSCVAMI